MSKAVVMAGWDDVPHLTERDKAELLAATPPHQRDARSKGVPQLGSGAIYPVPEAQFTCEPIRIPDYWPRIYGLDVGWRVTAAIWLAHDRDADLVYAYSEHYREQAEPSVHAAGIKARGVWIPGQIDPAAAGKGQRDGQRIIDDYRRHGLQLRPADNAVEAGILAVWDRLSTGRLRVFTTLPHLLAELRLYRRDDKGRVVKQNDHALDALRYAVMGLRHARTRPAQQIVQPHIPGDSTIGY